MRSLLVLLAVSACCPAPWSVAGAPNVRPDAQYREPSSTHGNDVYLWTCFEGHHVVVSQYSAEMSCQAPKLERFDCGTLSPLELATPEGSRVAVPKSQQWP